MRRLAFFLLLVASFSIEALGEPQVHCGEIAEDEFTKSGEFHDFLLNLEPGAQLDLVLVPVGTTLKFHMKLLEPTGNVTHLSNEVCCSPDSVPNRDHYFVGNARIKTEAISSRGFHTIRVYNWNAGVYSLYVNCILRNGRDIKAGSEIYEPSGSPSPARMQAAPAEGAPMGQQGLPSNQPVVAGNPQAQLKTAAVDFVKQKATSWVSQKLSNTKAGSLIGGLSAPAAQPSVQQAPAPSSPPQAFAPAPDPQGGAAVAQELLVSAAPQSQQVVSRPQQPVSLNVGSAAPRGVTLYSDKNFVGGAESFLDSDANLKDNPIGNDSASSVRVGNGCVAILYADANFEGKSISISQDVLNLRETRIGNDSVSSIRVRCEGVAYY